MYMALQQFLATTILRNFDKVFEYFATHLQLLQKQQIKYIFLISWVVNGRILMQLLKFPSYQLKLYLRMQANQTPFLSIQRRDKERKNHILNSIEGKDLKRRSISYNFKTNYATNEQNAQMDSKNDYKEHLSNITINNTIKKSYYCRKLMNKSIDSHLTSEEFQRVKEKFDRVNYKDSPHDNKSIYFRQIWQREQYKRHALSSSKDQQNYLEVVSKNSQKYKTLQLQPDNSQKKKDEVVKSILDIASERRTTLNFDLEILGNKKSIRIKDNKLKMNTISNIKTTNQQHQQKETDAKAQQPEPKAISVAQQQKKQGTKLTCTFFKRFQQENAQIKQIKVQRGNQFLQITKISQQILPIPNSYQFQNIKLKKLKLRQYQSEIQPDYHSIIRREIQSSWRPMTRASMQKCIKVETSHDRRTALRHKNIPISNFTNDIKGWMVQPENDQELLQNFQS